MGSWHVNILCTNSEGYIITNELQLYSWNRKCNVDLKHISQEMFWNGKYMGFCFTVTKIDCIFSLGFILCQFISDSVYIWYDNDYNDMIICIHKNKCITNDGEK